MQVNAAAVAITEFVYVVVSGATYDGQSLFTVRTYKPDYCRHVIWHHVEWRCCDVNDGRTQALLTIEPSVFSVTCCAHCDLVETQVNPSQLNVPAILSAVIECFRHTWIVGKVSYQTY